MEPLQLADGSFSRRLKVVIDDACAGQVAQRVIDTELFTSIHRQTVERELWQAGHATTRLEPRNPFLSDEDQRHLDEQGLIRAGTVLRADSILASAVRNVDPHDTTNQPPPGMELVHNENVQTPSGWAGAVVTAARCIARKELERKTPKNLQGCVEIDLELRRELQVGDVLLIDGEPVVVSGVADERLPGDADLAVSSLLGALLGLTPDPAERQIAKAEALAQNVLDARGTGFYSIITRAPLRTAQTISAAHLTWLRERNLNALVSEFAALKSDDIHRHHWLPQVKSALTGSTLEPAHAPIPECLRMQQAELQGLGLKTQMEAGDGCVRIALRPWLDGEIVATSGGEIRKPETINYRTYRPEAGGLFAEEIFGPEERERREPHGHLDLGCAVALPLYRFGDEPLLPQLLELSPDDVERIVMYQSGVMWRGTAELIDFVADREPEDAAYLGTGAQAIAALLARVPEVRLPFGLRGRVAGLTPTILPVLAPDLRPLVLLENGNFATSDLNDLYRRIINRSNRLRKLVELKAPAVILANERRQLQQAVDSLHVNSLVRSRSAVLGSNNRPLVDLASLLVLDLHGKRVDFSGSARLVLDRAVPPLEAVLPEAIYRALVCDGKLPVLLTMELGAVMIARYPRSHQHPVIKVHPATAQWLGIDTEPVEVAVHRPLTLAGVEETRRLVEEEPPVVRGVPERSAWCEVESSAEAINLLSRLVASGEFAPLDSSRGLLIGGTGACQWSTAEAPLVRQPERRAMPKP